VRHERFEPPPPKSRGGRLLLVCVAAALCLAHSSAAQYGRKQKKATRADVKVAAVPPKVGGQRAQAKRAGAKRAEDEDRLRPTPDPQSKYKVYVPASLEDAFAELEKMLSPKVRREMKEGAEEDMVRYHMGLGLWLRNNWGLWGGSRLARYFNGLGVHHPDDMSSIILDTFWRRLNDKPLRLEERVAHSQAYWKAMAAPKNKSCPDDGSPLEIWRWLHDQTEGGMPRVIHVGECKRRKHLWVYEHDKVWYKPTAEQLRRINAD
jgi:hypothetical protein